MVNRDGLWAFQPTKINIKFCNYYTYKKRLKTIESHGGKTNFEEAHYIRKDGSKQIARLNVVPLDDENVYGIAHDITDSKRAEEALRESQEKLHQTENVSPQCPPVIIPATSDT